MALGDIWGALTGNLGGLAQAGGLLGGGALINEAYGNVGDAGKMAYDRSKGLAQELSNQLQFKPFTVTTGLGGFQTDPTGGFNLTLSPEQQALQNQLMGGAQGFYNQALMPTQERQQEIYNKLRALQTPDEQRQALALEERLLGQGRLGLQTAQYGGAPEQLALAKAQQEAQNQAALMALQQAQAEQMQQAQLGQAYQQAGYMPQQQMLDAYKMGLGGAGLAGEMQKAAALGKGETEMSGLQALLSSRLGQANMMGQLGQMLIGGTMNNMNAQTRNNQQTSLGGLFSSLFGGNSGGGSTGLFGAPVTSNDVANFSFLDLIPQGNYDPGAFNFNTGTLAPYTAGSQFNLPPIQWDVLGGGQ